MNLLKQIGTWIVGILLLVLTLGMVKPSDKKWQEKAADNEEKDIQNDLHSAEVASGKAKEHDSKAKDIKAEAEKEVKDAKSTRSILDRIRRS